MAGHCSRAATVLPAALAVVIVSTWTLARECLSPSVELLLAVTVFVGLAVLGLNPPVLLVLQVPAAAPWTRSRARPRLWVRQGRLSRFGA